MGEQPASCPWCGSAPEVYPHDPTREGNAFGMVVCVNQNCPTYDRAWRHGVSIDDGLDVADDRGSDAYKQAAIQRWNAVARIPPAVRAELEATADALREMVNHQAEDDGLWFIAQTAPEAYLQQELRRLHAAVEAYLAARGDAAQAERERCARIAETCSAEAEKDASADSPFTHKAPDFWDGWAIASEKIAAAIRAGEEP